MKKTLRRKANGFGRRLRLARLAAAMTMDELGVQLGDPDGGNVRRWETTVAIRLPRAETLLEMARVLAVPMEWLAAGTGNGPDQRTQDMLEVILSQIIRRYQAKVEAHANEDEIQEYWELITHAYALLASQYPTAEGISRSLARISAGAPPMPPAYARRGDYGEATVARFRPFGSLG